MSIDNSLIGSVINALPMDRMIAGPLQAMVQAQVTASKSYADFLMQVCVQDGKAVAIQFDYDETIVDEQGQPQGVVKKTLQVPLMAAITHPNIAIENGTVEFELVVNQMSEATSARDMNAEGAASLGWGPFKLNVKGSVSHKSSQTRKTDTRARYAFNTTLKRQDPPEAMMRVIDFLTEAATKPIIAKDVTQQSPALSAPPQAQEELDSPTA
ncbi:DUF2589 domain-containing protein [Pseudomonas putida]|uniref:DUF2589 domain-containing protein n=1 Tax=Pseudomonas TaxID=286 RepID=UPI0011A3ABA3|nr:MULTISPECIES: DUF2589 domain-containing protein [Pseudomonas]MBF8636416.1 DUF2589 domain-containing protein [Pseudomonas fulva]MBF8650918.1 DUF2589 domain-containing protein [Pseudomonas putida]MBF8655683.1 DUF2589 domain-containing protein [Pseudomonas putida]MBF8678801.1 DUF2589 domain-containing protein [Pseudomonas fulva]MBF8690012.1 DUF2589 domain-containing protein [Pseudomonas fulva]